MLLETRTLLDTMEILILDPDPVSRLVAMALMKRSGYSPNFVADERVALEVLGKKHYDLVIMDVDMFTQNPGEVAAGIRSPDGPNPATPLLGISSGMDGGEPERIRDSGLNGFLVKPYDFTLLLDEIHRVAGPSVRPRQNGQANGWWRSMGEIVRQRDADRSTGLDDPDGHVSGSPAGQEGAVSGVPLHGK